VNVPVKAWPSQVMKPPVGGAREAVSIGASLSSAVGAEAKKHMSDVWVVELQRRITVVESSVAILLNLLIDWN